jgi:hypothetical protein
MTEHARPLVTPRTRVALVVGFALLYATLVASSPMRRVGDGGNYLAIAINLANLRLPSLSSADRAAIRHRFATVQSGFEVVSLEMPSLKARDGRQDLPHFWLYPLAASPLVAGTEALGVHPIWAFTVLNLSCLLWAIWVVGPRIGTASTLLIFAGPMLWWIDKVHNDSVTLAILTVAATGWRSAPAGALLLFGLACALNPAMSLAWPACVAGVWWSAPDRRLDARLWQAVAGSAALVLLQPAYYLWRLGTPTPLLGWTSRHWPEAREMLAFLIEPNIGLLPSFPVLGLAVLMASAAMAVQRQSILRQPHIWMPPVLSLVLLAAFTQSVNANHGGTPGPNRWVFWLVPLAAPLLGAAVATLRQSGRIVAGCLAVASATVSVMAYHPKLPESYLAPTRLARHLWQHTPTLVNPPAEVFAERMTGAEPPPIPAATPGCTKALLVEGRWPFPCAPFDAPPNCTAPGTLCYANARGEGYVFAAALAVSGYHYDTHDRTWPTDPTTTADLRRLLREFDWLGMRLAASSAPGSMLRASERTRGSSSLQAEDRLLVYVTQAAEGAAITLRVKTEMRGALVELGGSRRTTAVHVVPAAPWDAVDVELPWPAESALLILREHR